MRDINQTAVFSSSKFYIIRKWQLYQSNFYFLLKIKKNVLITSVLIVVVGKTITLDLSLLISSPVKRIDIFLVDIRYMPMESNSLFF